MKIVKNIFLSIAVVLALNFFFGCNDDTFVDLPDLSQYADDPVVEPGTEYIVVYSDDTTMITSTWLGNGSGLSEVIGGAFEGSFHYQYDYKVSGWWDGFGFYVPEVDVTGADSLQLAFKGPNIGQRIDVKIKDPNGQSKNVRIGQTNDYKIVNIAMSDLLKDLPDFDLTKIVEITFTVGGAENAEGTIYVDKIAFVIPPPEEEE